MIVKTLTCGTCTVIVTLPITSQEFTIATRKRKTRSREVAQGTRDNTAGPQLRWDLGNGWPC